MRKHTKRKPVPPVPFWLRPKLTKQQRTALEICHLETLDAIAKGKADWNVAMNWAGGVITWANVARMLRVGEAEMDEQMNVANAVLDRYRRTGKFVFTGPEYQTAKVGIDVMTALAERTDKFTAVAAAEASEAALARFDLCAA